MIIDKCERKDGSGSEYISIQMSIQEAKRLIFEIEPWVDFAHDEILEEFSVNLRKEVDR